MNKVFRYSLLELVRNRWLIVYMVFIMLATGGFLYLGGDHLRAQASMMNVVILMVPLIALIFGLMYMYQVREYVELLLAQPISRKAIFFGYYFGVTTALSLFVVLGFLIPVLIYFPTGQEMFAWGVIMLIAVLLSFIFAGFACYLALAYENKLKGFGLALFLWLFLAILYDGLFLVLLFLFEDYPLENFALIGTMLNPIDLGRTLIIFQLDFSALMGYTGAVFKKFFGSGMGSAFILLAFALWCLVPFVLLTRKIRSKDF